MLFSCESLKSYIEIEVIGGAVTLPILGSKNARLSGNVFVEGFVIGTTALLKPSCFIPCIEYIIDHRKKANIIVVYSPRFTTYGVDEQVIIKTFLL